MLEEMRISGLGVIDDAVVEFGAGLTAVTGETGAGKTMVVSGLGLLLGGRADSGLVRTGASRAVVEGRLRLDSRADSHDVVAAQLAEIDAELDEDGSLLVSRTVGADGRSRAFIGGRAVPVGVLAEIMPGLVAVHGQAEQLRLRRPATHRLVLDRFAGDAVTGPLTSYVAAYGRHREVSSELHEVITSAQERAREADLLRFGLDEIAAAAPESGEDVALAAEVQRLSHADTLLAAAAAARRALLGDPDGDDLPDAHSLIVAAATALNATAEHDVALAELAQRVTELQILLTDVGGDVATYISGLDTDPARLAIAAERQATLGRLVRKYDETGAGVDGVLAWAREATARLADLDDGDRSARLTAEHDRLGAELTDLAAGISSARNEAAQRLEREVAAELDDLAMPDARITVAVTPCEPGPTGADDVALLIAVHEGAPARPVQRAASGGELSRVMLALEVVLAGRDRVPTFVFDEVDAGVGGRAAAEVGRRLALLATTAQVVVVTHLPQVAAYADRHLLVEKSATGRATVVRSDVSVLDGGGRVAELSRMLAGLADSEHARGHAEELLAAAAEHRSAIAS